MQALLALSRAIDRINEVIGKSVGWLILVAVIVSAVNATVRKVFSTSSNAWLELQWQLFGAVFMLAAAYTLQMNAHVRIDAISGRLSKRSRDVIDLVGHMVMLLPITLIMIWLTVPFFWASYVEQEMSSNAGGLLVWPAKFLIFAGFVLLFIQALSEMTKRLAVISGVIADPETQPVHGHVPSDTSITGGHNQ